ncbi:MAG TPA: D-alanine--D-alanine ligase family protein [Thermoanaerobaculia bacterium]|nr:D-alanine--D-alanine ligase family protein [Thermoanaerobaculia bacterium]
MKRLKVVVLYGGRSVEREVSRVSARTIVGGLDRSRYEVVPLAVDPSGRFLSAADSSRMLAEGPVPDRFRRAEPAGGALVPLEISAGRADVVFPIIHGTSGEDGTLQGFLEFLGIPYVGAGVAGSAIGMDKAVFKALLRSAGIPTPRSVVVRSSDRGTRARELVAGLPLPLFTKPATGGSSVGVRKVKDLAQLDAAIEEALRYDDRALVEEGIDARELECAVLGDEDPRASVPGEVVPGHEFYDYDDKYRDDKSRLLIPAPVSEKVAAEVQRLAVESFRLCGLSGMARVDFFLERGTDRVLVNEVNTLPGFTAISMYPKLWEASGVPLPALLDELIRLAIARKERRDRLSHEPPAELQ